METPSRRRTAEKCRTDSTEFSVAVGVGWSTRTPRTYTTDADAISFTFCLWFTTVLRFSAATVSAGGSRWTPSEPVSGGRTDLCAFGRVTSSLHHDFCCAAGVIAAPLSATHDGPMILDLIRRCSSMGVCVPRTHVNVRPRTSAGRGAFAAG